MLPVSCEYVCGQFQCLLLGLDFSRSPSALLRLPASSVAYVRAGLAIRKRDIKSCPVDEASCSGTAHRLHWSPRIEECELHHFSMIPASPGETNSGPFAPK